MKVRDLLKHAEQELIGVKSARLDAEVLLASSLGTNRASLYAHPDQNVPPEAESSFSSLLDKRRQAFPLAYLLGSREFWSMELKVDANTLIPRPETELLVEQALLAIPTKTPCRVLDLGTGSGAIALAIACERPQAEVLAVDISTRALDVARQNAQDLEAENVEFLHSDWFADIDESEFDVIVSNPPYVETRDPGFELGEIRYEPRLALDGGEKGMDAYHHIVPLARDVLCSRGRLLLEHGWQQGPALRELLETEGFQQVQTLKDYAGLERCSTAGKV